MENPKTASVLGQILATAFGTTAGDGTASMESDDATAQATMFAMPLKSLASFSAMGEEQYQGMVDAFRAAQK